jgi:nicotinate-nucleotide pyrophosphorylase (carboxylating)
MPFQQIDWDEYLIDDCRQLIRLGVREDLDRSFDVTTLSLIGPDDRAKPAIVARSSGAIAGLPVAELVLQEMNIPATWEPQVADGERVTEGDIVALLAGPARDLLTAERLLLNFLGRLSGIASFTRQFVDAVGESTARIYDTRKTTPGWRRLEKYAVRCGGGFNHRTGLFDAVLIKDNHLAHLSASDPASDVASAVAQVRHFLEGHSPLPIEIEVDTLAQLKQVLPAAPDIVLLDNMSVEQLRSAVSLRDKAQVATQLEASGGITLATVAEVAATGVDRLSVGALTHSALSLDLAMDWEHE